MVIKNRKTIVVTTIKWSIMFSKYLENNRCKNMATVETKLIVICKERKISSSDMTYGSLHEESN